MTTLTRIKYILFAAVFAAAMQTGFSSNASAGLFSLLPDQTGCCRRCPACDYVCKLDAEKGEEDRLCFDVESKVVCIPRVVFPWQKKSCASCTSCDGNGCSHCVNNGARARKVCVLKPSSYQCPKCKYTWSAEKRGSCRGGCSDGNCACDAAIGVEPFEQPQQPNADQPLPAPAAFSHPFLTPQTYGRQRPTLLPRVGTLPPASR